MSTDLLLYIVIAVALVFWLRNTLGTRHGEERERRSSLEDAGVKQTLRQISDILEENPDDEDPFQKIGVTDRDVAENLHTLMRADRSFNPARFVDGAKDAFAMIVEAFAKGDLRTLKDLLAPGVYASFEQVIEDRAARGETVATEVHAVRKAEIADVRLIDRMAFVKIRFTADETFVIRDRDGSILSGHPDKVTEMTDLWTFGRDTRSKDPTWFLYETADDVPEDHDNKTPVPDAGGTV